MAPNAGGTILLCHGYYADRHQVACVAEQLTRHGFDAIAVELRGHGERPGPCTLGIREAHDVRAVVDWIESQGRPASRGIGLLGLSMGAAVACQVAVDDSRVRALVTDSAYPRFFPLLRQDIAQRYHLPGIPWAWLTWWGLCLILRRRLGRLDPIRLAVRGRQPLLAIHGGADVRVPPADAEAFAAAWQGPTQRWSEPGVPHVGMCAHAPEAYGRRVAAFFREALACRE